MIKPKSHGTGTGHAPHLVNRGTLEQRTQFFDAHVTDKNRSGTTLGSVNAKILGSEVSAWAGEPALYIRFKQTLDYVNKYGTRGFALSFNDIKQFFDEMIIKRQDELVGREVSVSYVKPTNNGTEYIAYAIQALPKSR